MRKILGLDLGTNSIGWAVIERIAENDGKIIDIGTRIFPEGVNRDNIGKEIKKNEQRRMKRLIRRQLFRRKLRKWQLATFLIKYHMFPEVENVKKAIQSNSKELQHFFSINPIECRSKAVTGEKLSLLELGRIFYHFAQRRGYKESLKDDTVDSGTLYEGSIKDSKTGINETSALIAEFQTLGNALFQLNPYVSENKNNKRWRNRYTTRNMYTSEFEIIWKKQQQFYPDILNEELKQKIGNTSEGLLFFQRPLKSQSHLIGKCSLEVNKPRSNDSCIAFELRRTYEFINSIKLDGVAISAEQKEKVKELFFTKDKFEFGEIAKKLNININRFNYEKERIVIGTKSISSLRKIFTPKIWDTKTLQEQEEILNIKRYAEDKDKTAEYLRKKFKFSEKQVEKFLKFKLSKGYSSLSYKATTNILPFLEKGHIYNEAVWLGGILNAFGKSNWDALPKNQKDDICAEALKIYYNQDVDDSLTETIKWLNREFKLTEKQTKKLYHHSFDSKKGDVTLKELPPPPNIKNPVVMQALFELNKLVNAIIYKYGKPDQIRVELSRQLKSSIEERDKMRLMQYQNETENNTIKSLLDEIDQPHTPSNILKYKLYREIEKRNGQVICPYSGIEITPRKLFTTKEFEVEHIIPYSIYPDDSIANKTLISYEYNSKKGNRTPYNFFKNDFGVKHWEDIKQRALSLLPYPKWLRFIDEKNKTLEDFESRKLNDNRYISREAKRYLECVCSDVRITQGELTAKLRRYWGLDSILNPSIPANGLKEGKEYLIAINEQREILEAIIWQNDKKKNDEAYEKLAKQGWVLQGIVKNKRFFGYKERYDHRHHAVDAITIACTKNSDLQAISTMKGRTVSKEEFEAREINFKEPWEGFQQEVKKQIEQLLISHKKRSRTITKVSKNIQVNGKKVRVSGLALRGPLHAETIYGKRKDNYQNEAYHVRKNLSQINKRAQVDKIADIQVRRIVEQAIIQQWKKENESLFEKYIQDGLIILKGNTYTINHLSEKKYDVPDGAFFEIQKDEKKRIIGIKPKVFIPINMESKSEEEQKALLKKFPAGKIPILKVRMKEKSSGAVQLKGNLNQWVEPDNNYGVIIYEDEKGELQEHILTFWDAVERKKQRIQIFELPSGGKKLVATLQKNDLFIIGIPESEINWNNKLQLSQHLYRVQKLSSMYYVFRKATAATLDFEKEQVRIQSFKSWNQLTPVKVRLDVLGNIQKLPVKHR